MTETGVQIIVEARDGGRRDFACEPGDTVLVAGLRAGLGFPYECNSGSCGACAFELLEGDVTDAWDQAPGLESARLARGFRLACQAHPSRDCRIKVRLRDHFVPVNTPRRFLAMLQSRKVLAPGLEEFSFQTHGEARFLPGQYAMLRLPGVLGARAYSMCNLPNREGRWDFIIKRTLKGSATSVLFDALSLDTEVGLEGPFGLAHLRSETPRDIILVAGGSGLSPILSIARAAARGEAFDGRRIQLFHGARSVEDLCAGRLLANETILAQRVELIEAISNGDDATDGWMGERGFIHQVLERRLGPEAASSDFYFCGPPLMTDAVYKLLLLKLRVPADHLHFDRFY